MKYDVISADPPWAFKTYSDKGGREKHYDRMTLQDIKNIPVHKIAHDHTVLLQWTTWPHLFEAREVAESWGFTYYATLGFIWVKRTPDGSSIHHGMGYYTRANTEPCLIFKRGRKFSLPRVGMDVHQVIETFPDWPALPGFEEIIDARVGRHSAKPEAYYQGVERLWGDVSRIEVFARQCRPGWAVVGNEIGVGLDVNDAINTIASMKRKEEVS